MSSPTFRCLQCRANLNFYTHEHKIWHRCPRCFSSYVPIHFLTAILSEFQYNKFVYDFQKAQVRISKNCPCCQTQMIKIYNVKGEHEIEACTVCQLAWLEPLEGFKIKHDSTEKEKKIVISSDDAYVDPLFQRGFQKSYTGGAVSWLLRALGLEKLSEKYPVLAFLIMAVILVFIFKFIFSSLMSGHSTTYTYGEPYVYRSHRFNLLRWLFY